MIDGSYVKKLVGYALQEYFRRRRETPAYFEARPHIELLRLRHPRDFEDLLRRAR